MPEPRSLTEQPRGTFEAAHVTDLPDPVRRYFESALTPGAPLAVSGHLAMRRRIRIGRWLPFRAREVLHPHRGFVWSARAAGVIVGSDRYVDGEGSQRWKLAGLITVMSAQGPDVSRSAAGRAAAEAVWFPAALLPRFGVAWSVEGEELVARYQLDDTPIECHYRLDEQGRPRSIWFDRWGDPDETGTWGWHRFGGEFTEHRRFGEVTVPSAGRLGWHAGTARWPAGEFFRFELTDLDTTVDPPAG